MAFATDKEIEYAEGLLLPRGAHFNDDRREIIKCNESKAFHACPGSGKTTTLLAKIVILANRMPFADGRGICVLTHTNVAIDEIKARLGEKANVLFTYPNFFGTFQTFVHKFFTEQALWHYHKARITCVDDNYAIKRLMYTLLPNKGKLNGNMFGRWNINHQGLTFDDYRKQFLLNMRIDWQSRTVIPAVGCGKHFGLDSDSGGEIEKAKNRLFAQGILTYDDAYMLALKYIREIPNNPYKDIVANRFAYVFIDEQQDVNPLQQELVNMVFGGDSQVVQTFGDTDQAIYQERSGDQDRISETSPNSIDDSCRFGEPIAQVLRNVCVREYPNLKGNIGIESQRPIMLVYSDTQRVLPKFAELLSGCNIGTERLIDIAKKKHEKDESNRYFVKAVGYRVEHGNTSSSASALDLKSYFPQYERITAMTKRDSAHISDYLRTKGNEGAKDHRINLTNAIVIALDACGIRDDKGRKFNATSLMRYLREKDHGKDVELKSKIAHWIMLLKNNEKQMVAEEMLQYLANSLTTYLPQSFETDVRLPMFFAATEEESGNVEQAVRSNIYHDEQTGVDIEVASVHAVKGETHLATLYLETADHGSTESQLMKRALEGEQYVKSGKKESRISRIMYVGMSRPKHLLCYAIHRDNYATLDAEKVKLNWEVREI